MPSNPMPPADVAAALKRGLVIPAHPLALTTGRKLDEQRQRALTRYYVAAGAGGIAVGVHTTQFEIHDAHVRLYQPVLELAAETAQDAALTRDAPVVRIAGLCGETAQAVAEARLASELGYHAGLLSLSAMRTASDDALLDHCRTVAEAIPIFGFYLQPSVGGRILGFDFWVRFAEIENVIAIKMAPFNRYQTIDVVRAVAEAGRAGEIALYTGNDDNIVADLLTEYVFVVGGKSVTQRIVGGLLGHWAVWTKKATELLAVTHSVARAGEAIPASLLTRGIEVTDMNAALFDPAHDFAGCIPGIHEVLRRQGLLAGRWCLNSDEDLSPGQLEEIDRVCAAYPALTDDDFVAAHLDAWLA